jgi:hypothetical protein
VVLRCTGLNPEFFFDGPEPERWVIGFLAVLDVAMIPILCAVFRKGARSQILMQKNKLSHQMKVNAC